MATILEKRPGGRKGFTLVELMVVIAMLGVLVASLTAAVRAAMRQSKIAKATTEVREITHAILAYENAAKDNKLPSIEKQDASRSTLKFLLGEGTDADGNRLPIFYEAALVGDMILDPWGTPYKVLIREQDVTLKAKESSLETATFMPNFYRMSAEDEVPGKVAK